jgi:transcriptional regulator with XRE-family HTH domain
MARIINYPKNSVDELLKRKNITSDELAKRTKLGKSAISQFKNQKNGLSIENVIKITKVFGCSIGELFCEIPLDFKDIENIKIISNINNFACVDDILSNSNNYNNYGISKKLLGLLGAKNQYEIILTNINNTSMYNTINSNDYVFIDIKEKNIVKDGLYLIKEHGTLEIRRIIINDKNSTVSILKDNKEYKGSLEKNYKMSELEDIVDGKVLKIIKDDI